jgi:ornithine cyclodeaminase/alanine dehydrogenase-like protein (mu-crystallin family)
MTAVAEKDEGEVGAILPEWLSPGALAVPLANDFGWTSEALESCGAVWVDDINQFQSFIDRGELTRSHNIAKPQPFASLLASGESAPAEGDTRTCAINLGLAIHDIVLASEVARVARERGIGTVLPR